MRYIIALTVVGVLIGAISLWANHLANTLKIRMHQRLVDAQTVGDIPQDIDLNRANFNDFGTEVSALEMRQINLMDLWFACRIILIPTLIVGGLAVAHFIPSRQSSIHVAKETAP